MLVGEYVKSSSRIVGKGAHSIARHCAAMLDLGLRGRGKRCRVESEAGRKCPRAQKGVAVGLSDENGLLSLILG